MKHAESISLAGASRRANVENANMTQTVTFRSATPGDAMDLARLINIAGDGLPHYFWQTAKAPGQTTWEFGANRAQREDGSFSYRNTILAMVGDSVAGCAVQYVIERPASVDDYTEMPEVFVPIQQLEDQAVGSLYLSVLAVYPEFRGMGIGAKLVNLTTDEEGQDQTLIVADANSVAIRLYEGLGFVCEATRAMAKDGWIGAGDTWNLMRRPLPGDSGNREA